MPTADLTRTPRPSEEYRLQCMELWGGNSETRKHLSMTGVECEIDSRPYDEGQGGGDVYYFTSCASGRISRVLLADVSGHGQRVAETADKLRGIMRANVNVIKQSSLMASINREFSQITEMGGFATAVVATYFSPRRSLTISIAGHPRPLQYRASTGRWSLFGESAESAEQLDPAMPLGIVVDVDFQTLSVPFERGDRLLCYTDAYSEAVNRDGEYLQAEGLRRLVEQLPAEDSSELIARLRAALKDLNGENLTNDDATAILIRPTGNSIPMKDNLMAAVRLIRGVRDVKSSEGDA